MVSARISRCAAKNSNPCLTALVDGAWRDGCAGELIENAAVFLDPACPERPALAQRHAKFFGQHIYYRRNTTRTLNGDMNDEFEDGPFDGASPTRNPAPTTGPGRRAAGRRCVEPDEPAPATDGGRLSDYARVKFKQTQQIGTFDTPGAFPTSAPRPRKTACMARRRRPACSSPTPLPLAPTLHLMDY